MKKTYIAPAVEVQEFDTRDYLMAGSLGVYDSIEVDTTADDDGGQLGREDSWRHGNNNAWDQGW